MKKRKTPDLSFKKIKDFPYKPHYVNFDSFRMHYIDEGKGEIILALHGEPSWSYLYRKFIPHLKRYRFIAPDLIGFGKSDKITGCKNYSFQLHFKSLKNFIEKLHLNDITLVVQDWGGLLGLSLLGKYPEKFKRIVILNTFLPLPDQPLPFMLKLWRTVARYSPVLPIGLIMQIGTYSFLSRETRKAYKAPFPASQYKSGARAFPLLIPTKSNSKNFTYFQQAQKVLSGWKKPALVMFSDKDVFLGKFSRFFYELIPTANKQKKVTIKNAGHFLQEDKGKEIAVYIDKFIKGELQYQ